MSVWGDKDRTTPEDKEGQPQPRLLDSQRCDAYYSRATIQAFTSHVIQYTPIPLNPHFWLAMRAANSNWGCPFATSRDHKLFHSLNQKQSGCIGRQNTFYNSILRYASFPVCIFVTCSCQLQIIIGTKASFRARLNTLLLITQAFHANKTIIVTHCPLIVHVPIPALMYMLVSAFSSSQF